MTGRSGRLAGITRIWLLAGAAVLGLACSEGSTAGPEPDPAIGFWELETVDGAPLPYPLIIAPGYRLEWTADAYLVGEDGNFIESSDFREFLGDSTGTFTEMASGRWTRLNSGSIEFAETGAPVETATIAGTRLTFVYQGISLVYRKTN